MMGFGLDAIGPARAAVEKLEGLSNEEIIDMLLLRCPLTRDDVSICLKKVF
jgi:hypothetical protein